MAQLTLTQRTQITIFALFIAAGLIGVFLGNPLHRFRADEETVC